MLQEWAERAWAPSESSQCLAVCSIGHFHFTPTCVPLWSRQGRDPGVKVFALSVWQCLKKVGSGGHLAPKMNLEVPLGAAWALVAGRTQKGLTMRNRRPGPLLWTIGGARLGQAGSQERCGLLCIPDIPRLIIQLRLHPLRQN